MCFDFIKKLFGKEEYIEPIPVDDIGNVELLVILKKEFGITCKTYLSDKTYKLTTKDIITKFLFEDPTNLAKYVPEYYDCPVPEDVAYSMGLFFADGSCGFRNNTKSGAWWRLSNTNNKLLDKAMIGLKQIPEPGVDFKVSSFKSEKKGTTTNYGTRNKDLNHIEVTSKKYGRRGHFIEEFRNWYYINGYKKVPAPIIDSQLEAKRAFLTGVIDGDGHTFKSGNTGIITCLGTTGLCGLVKLMMDLNWKYTIYEDKRKEDIHCIYYNKKGEELDESKNFCDDFSYRLMGQLSTPELADIAFGILWTGTPNGGHAINLFVDKNKEVWIVEPQTDKIFKFSDKAGWNAWLVVM